MNGTNADPGLRARKKELRKFMSGQLERISAEETARESAAVTRAVLDLDGWKGAERIFIFLSMGKEIDTSALIRAAASDRKIIAVPRMYGKEIRFHRIRGLEDSFSIHPYGVREPLPEWPLEEPEAREKDFVVTPGIAFDRSLNRLGYGRGYYDRFFSSFPGKFYSVGVCFGMQLVDEVPRGPDDLPVHALVAGGDPIGAGSY